MTRKLSERQEALYVVAEAFETTLSKRTQKQYRLTLFGICKAMKVLGIWSSAGFNGLVNSLDKSTGSVYLCPKRNDYGWHRRCDLWRSTLASFLAAMPDEDYNKAFEVEK